MDSISPDAALMASGATFRMISPSSQATAASSGRAASTSPKRPPQILPLLHPGSWTEPAPPRSWIVPDWVPRKVVTSLYGDGGVGKSLLAQQLLTCTALCLPWLGLDTQGGRALGVFCEDDVDELQRRQQAINAELGVVPSRLADLRLLSRLGDDNILMDFTNTDVGLLTGFFADLDATMAEFKPVLLVLDTAADLFGGNENVRPQVRRFIGTCLGSLARDHDCAVLLLAHPSQSGLRDGSGTGGSTAWNNTVRSRLYLTRPTDEEGAAMSDARVLTRMKANYASADGKIDMVWRNGAFTVAAATQSIDPATWPIIHAMFDEIQRAWDAGNPWSSSPQTRDGGRYFPAWAKSQHSLPEKRTKTLLSDWMMSGCLTIEQVDSDSKLKGLRVIRRPNQEG